MTLYLLFILAAVAGLIFAVPVRAKSWTALTLVAAGMLAAAIPAVGILSGAEQRVALWEIAGPFGTDRGMLDPLSALFVVVIAIGSVASVLY